MSEPIPDHLCAVPGLIAAALRGDDAGADSLLVGLDHAQGLDVAIGAFVNLAEDVRSLACPHLLDTLITNAQTAAIRTAHERNNS
ncbi:hypothetical protein [Streptomyces sp. SPB074]|uniref:hypothetical protein n=1 Tax=Streptomyces sp. (strain SPB074) TaxID=465543 RepID=UPI00017F27A7|nr:hypothetical protein [Streptomyces sp. SPB074]